VHESFAAEDIWQQ